MKIEIENIKSYITKGNARSIAIKKNIIGMLILKGLTILIGLVLVPMTINYVDSETYGLWLTLSSIVAWISFFDIGINNGLKNNLTQALAVKDYGLAKTLISTTYAILSLIFLPLMIILLILSPLLDWQSILNINNVKESELCFSVSIIVVYFCVNFILSTINIVLLSDQRPALSSVCVFFQQLLTLIAIFALTKTVQGSITILCATLCVSPLIVIVVFNCLLFNGRYKNIAPNIHYINFGKTGVLMKLGFQFFIIQIAGVIQCQMINFLILRNFGANDVTCYNISYKYFSVLLMVWNILTTPLWVAFTDAIAKNEMQWIINALRKYVKLFLLFIVAGFLMLIISDDFYGLWVGKSIHIDFILSVWVLLYVYVTMFSSIFVSFTNGAGALKMQAIACCISPIIFLGVYYVLLKSNVGLVSILVAAIVANFNGIILAPIQSYNIIKNNESLI